MKNVRYILIGFIFAYLIRCLVIGPSFQDALIVLTLSGIFALNEYLEQKKIPEVKAELEKQIQELRTEVKQLKMDVNKSSMAAIKPQFKF